MARGFPPQQAKLVAPAEAASIKIVGGGPMVVQSPPQPTVGNTTAIATGGHRERIL